MFETGRFPFPPRGALVAVANMEGSEDYPKIAGEVRIYHAMGGSVVEADIRGLPPYLPAYGQQQPIGPFGFHIHIHPDCEPMGGKDPFAMAGSHYNPENQPHGNHAGDMPVLMQSKHGKAQMAVYLEAFSPEEVVGKTVMIHENPDDFRTNPAGNSGKRIACGVIKEV